MQTSLFVTNFQVRSNKTANDLQINRNECTCLTIKCVSKTNSTCVFHVQVTVDRQIFTVQLPEIASVLAKRCASPTVLSVFVRSVTLRAQPGELSLAI